MDNTPIIKEVLINAPAKKVWQALTDKDQIKSWSFDIAEFKPEPGFEFRFYGGTEHKQYLHLCKITVADPEKKLAYTWAYENIPVETLVTFELFPEGENATRVKLTHVGTENFPAENPDLAKANFVAGWEHIIGTLLKEFVEQN